MPKKSPLDLLRIFSEFSPTKMSNGQIRMECPFRENHKDGSGRMSFFASPEINAYHCFSCGAKGNLVNLLTTRFKIGYFEASSAVHLEEFKPKEEKVFDFDVVWDFNKPPKEFLKRGFTEETLRYFRVGMMDSGEILIPYYESFVKPINLLGYQKRVYYPDRKVRNSRHFNKKEYLYNFDDSYTYVVLVEGQSDVWRLHQFGYNACALMGADMSSWQADKLSCFERVYLALDNDAAGRRGIEICNRYLSRSVDVRLVPYTTKDPGECDKKSWVSAFDSSTDYMVYSLEMAMNWDGYLDMRDEVLTELDKRSDFG